MSARKIGVEEELMLVDPDSGELAAVSRQAVRAHKGASARWPHGQPASDIGEVEQELFLQQIETATEPHRTVDGLADEIGRKRRAVCDAAHAVGARAVAMPTPVLAGPGEQVTGKPRYERILEGYGETARQALVCAMHVHVEVDDDEEGVAVIDRIRPWLPVLLAISSNSPFWLGRDTGYASWRSQIWGQWPSSGPAESFGDVETYRRTANRVVEWGASVDQAMLYFDVRLAENYPTIEIRVADVCTDVSDAVLVAALTRGLVETGIRHWKEGVPFSPWRSDLLRAASWRAARYGTAAQLVHPAEARLAAVREVFSSLVEHVAPALDEAGDRHLVEASFESLLSRGNGAARQRSVFEATGDLRAVVRNLAERTEASCREG